MVLREHLRGHRVPSSEAPLIRDRAQALARARQGAEDGFAWLFAEYRLRLYRFLRRYPGMDADLANDVLQSAFVRAFRHLADLQDDQRLESWLLTITRREALRHLGRRRGHEPLEEAIEAEAAGEEERARQAEKERLLEAIRVLAPKVEPEAIRETALRYYFGPQATTEELAHDLGVPHATVRKRLYLFRDKLRALLLAEGST